MLPNYLWTDSGFESHTAAALKAKNGDREAALQIMGTLGLDWDSMGKMEEMKNACREVPSKISAFPQ